MSYYAVAYMLMKKATIILCIKPLMCSYRYKVELMWSCVTENDFQVNLTKNFSYVYKKSNGLY